MKATNIITYLSDHFYTWGASFPQESWSFFVHLNLILGLTTLACYCSFDCGCRARHQQIIIMVVSILLTGLIPAESFHVASRVVRTWCLLLSVFGIYVFCRMLPAYVFTELGKPTRA